MSLSSLDVNSLFASIRLNETIDICVNQLFKNSNTVNPICPGEFLSDHAPGGAHSVPDVNPKRKMLSTYNLSQSYFVMLQKKW